MKNRNKKDNRLVYLSIGLAAVTLIIMVAVTAILFVPEKESKSVIAEPMPIVINTEKPSKDIMVEIRNVDGTTPYVLFSGKCEVVGEDNEHVIYQVVTGKEIENGDN
ncbi:hypothetical protein LJC51_09030 [Lachnospiraceae bacterium OttesenSCG-928-J05]|nr:hypothetical protein [Lachnospiraceae bacterium OttesenSCG-928-J05]